MMELLKAISLGFVLLLPMANPLTAIAMFLGLSGGMSKSERDKTAVKSAVYTFIILLLTWYGGSYVMSAFGISVPGLRISGGLIVAFIGFTMLFPTSNDDDETKPKKIQTSSSISFVPISMPGTAGPGTMALLISAASTAQNDPGVSELVLLVAPIIVFTMIGILLWLGLRSSANIMRVLGEKGIDAISRLMGFLLVCMGVQFVINGVKEIIQLYPN